MFDDVVQPFGDRNLDRAFQVFLNRSGNKHLMQAKQKGSHADFRGKAFELVCNPWVNHHGSPRCLSFMSAGLHMQRIINAVIKVKNRVHPRQSKDLGHWRRQSGKIHPAAWIHLFHGRNNRAKPA